MGEELLIQAEDQAKRSSPAVRAAALMRIARVRSRSDMQDALRLLQEGLDIVPSLTSFDKEFLTEHGRLVAAAIAPHLVDSIPLSGRFPHHSHAYRVAHTMLDHGHAAEAAAYLLQADDSQFPFTLLSTLMPRLDHEAQLTLINRAIQAWRKHPDSAFIFVLQSQWHVLPEAAALVMLREVVDNVLNQPDSHVEASFANDVRMTSSRDMQLFQMLHILRRLDPALAESLIERREQLAAAAKRFPNGFDTIHEEEEAHRKAAGASCGGGYIMAGAPSDFPYMRSLIDASRDGEFSRTFEYALERYRQDTNPENPNLVVSEFWPSTCMFRSILYSAAQKLGEGAAEYLKMIPDPDLRLFAQIEMAAALAGLPQFNGTRREQHAPTRTPTVRSAVLEPDTVVGSGSGSGVTGPRIRCPKCKWSPGPHDRWACKCGHIWNTFDTGGVCPSCLFQWKVTACLSCREWSPHSDWYSDE